MGSFVGKVMEENFQKQQDFMVKNQEIMMQRNIQMQNQMRERQASMMMARARDLFTWWSAFSAVVATGGILGFMKTKKPGPLVPLVPLSFILGYQYDMSYGSKMQRCRVEKLLESSEQCGPCSNEADRIMEEETGLLQLPHGLPTLASIDAARLKNK